jgi:hypothetical protein
MEKTLKRVPTTKELAHLGGGVLAYVKEMQGAEAKALLGGNVTLPAQGKLYALFNADGSPISISGTRNAALGSAFEHDLIPASLH